MNDFFYMVFSFKVDGILVCKYYSCLNFFYVLIDKSNNFVFGNVKYC